MWHTKEEPFLGLQGMGGGASSLMWAGAGGTEVFDLYAWGAGEYGILGLNYGVPGWPGLPWQPNQPAAANDRSSPTQIPGDWYAIYGGSSYTLGHLLGSKDEEGTLWAWGTNGNGQLGMNDVNDGPHERNKSKPTQIGTDTNWVMAGCADSQTLALKDDNTVWGWGQGYYALWGGITPTTGSHKSSPTQLPSNWTMPGKTWSTSQLAMNVAREAFYMINTDGELWGWGQNYYGGLGQSQSGNTATPFGGYVFSSPVQIPGTWATCASWDRYGMVGGTKTDGSMWLWGGAVVWSGAGSPYFRGYSSPVQVPGSTWAHVSTSPARYLGVKTDGTMWYAGSKEYGLQGINEDAPGQYESPIQVGGPTSTNWSTSTEISEGQKGNSAIALKTDGSLWTWGLNYRGKLGHNDAGSLAQPWIPGSQQEQDSRSSPTQLPGTWGGSDSEKMYVASAYNSFFALKKQ